MWNSADMALALAPVLSAGAAMTIEAHASASLKARFLPKMYSGEWSGTMNLTEAQAGSDLGALKTQAEPDGDQYRIRGQKIFITWGDHDACENIAHLVLARLPGAPEGSRGISLFLVPKFLVNDDGSLGARNDVYPVSMEHKLGIHGSPTCVMAFGDNEGAIGYLVGKPNRGLACMFTMMNEARLKIGLQGLSTAQAAYQQALAHAKERRQGNLEIWHYPDVKRMLLVMKSLTEAMRAMAYTEALNIDLIHAGPTEQHQGRPRRVDLMIPIVKGWLTEVGQELASLAVQVHGGMGYVEETGVAQYFRDVRITAIYEGTNGIQANDLVGRKLTRDKGAAMYTVLEEIRETIQALRGLDTQEGYCIADHLETGTEALKTSTDTLLERWQAQPGAALRCAFDYLMQAGYTLGGWHLARSAALAKKQIDAGNPREFYPAKVATAVFYMEQVLPRAEAHAQIIARAETDLGAFPGSWF
jgi:alkylation response protein AidB-like acyl-CoA dehydrogenase